AKGTVQDSVTLQPLSNATISIINSTDSLKVKSTLSSGSGYFEIKNLDTGSYYLRISFQGFEILKREFSISIEDTLINLQTIKMQRAYKVMQEVIIKDEVPIRVKGDTVSFNANSFKTKPNATAEDLLKKLPGMQVDKDGTVKAQGENVPKIYVDGKEFFGDDPKMATKNIAADMIDRVELYDDISEQSKFNGIDDGSRSKAINLKLKKDKKKGVFGRASVGYGTDDRYQSSLSANYFKGATKVSVIVRANNTNNTGAGSADIGGASGSFGRNSGGSGITKNRGAGVNYSDIWGKKLEITSSYSLNHSNNTNISTSHRQTFFPDSTVTRNQASSSENNNNSHRIRLRLNYVIDSMSSIIYIPSINFQSNDNLRGDTTESFARKGNVVSKVNDSRSLRENSGDGLNWTNNFLYRRKLSKARRTFSVNLFNSYSNTVRNGLSNSRIGQYKNGNKTGDRIINQKSIQENNSTNYGVTFSYTEPVGPDKVLEFNYSFNNSKNGSDREVYDINDMTGKYDFKNLQQTNLFENLTKSNRLGTNFQVVKKKYNYQLGLGVQRTLLQSNNLSKNTIIEQKFTNLFPTASFNYQFARSKNVRFNYSGRTNQPSAVQLQEILNKDNPLFWTRGNATLKQEYTNAFSLNYHFFNTTNFRSLFFNASFFNTYNKIVNNVISKPELIRQYALLSPNDTIPQGVQLSMPLNADGVYYANGNFNIGFPIRRMKGGNFNTYTTISYNRNVNFADGVKNFTYDFSLGEELRVSYNHEERLDVGISVGIDYNSVKNTLQKNQNQNSSYYVYAASADISYTLPENFILSTDLDYATNTGLASGYNQSYFLWNASLSKQVFKNKRGELKLSINDILNQNTNVSRNTADNYIEDVRNLTLRRFAMLTFTYNLNRTGGKSTQAP
ncbi:MAG: outer membrane beta-barrel protein, partial [Bacteroidota bacterium]|nr:outer membrane beta-barrel protein [Bacteroidota bacterium]